ncbi:hypothetical protein TWF694_005086 [Orbilia ellipsospora]|uniref:Antifreeze protein n=1 Tax=Orbilia ellipsospora TaxID=2528407 RepID=A0AAV9WWN8_9PEZI
MKVSLLLAVAAVCVDLSYAHCKEATSLFNRYKCAKPTKTLTKTKTCTKTLRQVVTVTAQAGAEFVTITAPAPDPVTITADAITVSVCPTDDTSNPDY